MGLRESKMKVLIACEESQEVCKAFRRLRHEAYSCDILSCSGGYPKWHIQDDVLKHLNEGWDLMIAHPPCTYISNAGARHLYPKKVLNLQRKAKGDIATLFFMRLYNCDIPKICVENPIPSKIYGLPQYSQIIHPFEYGHKYKKATCLWLKNLPLLKPTKIVDLRESTKVPGNWFNKGGKDRQKNRAKTFKGIAEAMARQWTRKV